MINWKTDKTSRRKIIAIAERFLPLYQKLYDEKPPTMDTIMDIAAAHLNGCPLKLDELLHADDFNFLHDVFGIMNNINRQTGKLENNFLPRYAVNQRGEQ